MKRILKIIAQLTANYWQSASQYRLGAVIWIVNGAITPLILLSVWLVVSRYRSLGLNVAQLVTYYILSTLVIRLTQSWVAEDLTFLIKEGRISNYLVKPISFVYERVAKDQAYRLIRLISLAPFMALTVIINPYPLQISSHLLTWLLFILVIILAGFTSFIIETLVGMMTFWLGDAYGAFLLLFMIQGLLSGSLVPIRLMPSWLITLSQHSPFYIQVGLPIDILMGTLSPTQIISYLTQLLFWLFFIILLSRWSYLSMIKKYTAVGI